MYIHKLNTHTRSPVYTHTYIYIYICVRIYMYTYCIHIVYIHIYRLDTHTHTHYTNRCLLCFSCLSSRTQCGPVGKHARSPLGACRPGLGELSRTDYSYSIRTGVGFRVYSSSLKGVCSRGFRGFMVYLAVKALNFRVWGSGLFGWVSS